MSYSWLWVDLEPDGVGNESRVRIWVEVKYPEHLDIGDLREEQKEEAQAHGKKASTTWLRLAREIHSKDSPDSTSVYGWEDAFTKALALPEMQDFVESQGVQETKWVEKRASEGRDPIETEEHVAGRSELPYYEDHGGVTRVPLDVLVLPREQREQVVRERRTKHGPAIAKMRQAKEHSDRGDYGAKQAIMAELLHELGHEFVVDSPDEPYAGITHEPTGFRMHVPHTIVPAHVRRPTDSVENGSNQEKAASLSPRLEAALADCSPEQRDRYETFLASLGMGPKYVPQEEPRHECPECHGQNARWREVGADTDYNHMELRCPDCGHTKEAARKLIGKKERIERYEDHCCPHCDHVFHEKGGPWLKKPHDQHEEGEPWVWECPQCKGEIVYPEATDAECEGDGWMAQINRQQREARKKWMEAHPEWEKEAAAKKCCLMACFPDYFAKEVHDWQDEHISGDQLAGDGLERETHTTVLFGFPLSQDGQEILDAVQKGGVFSVTLGKIKRFRASERRPESDCLVVEVDSEALREYNTALREDYKVKCDYPTYRPHMTLAYVKPGALKELDGNTDFDGRQIDIRKLVYSRGGDDKISAELHDYES